MAYPTDTGQSYTTINGTDNTGATLGDGLTHSGRHNAVENEVTALKEKVGINGDSDNSTLDFKTSEITGGDTAVGKSATQTLTNKTLTSPTISLWDGWDERTVGDYSYASTTTINTTSDKTGEIQVGDKIKIVTAGGTFYFFVTAITSSLITVYGGTDYTVPNATFTQFAISRVKAPFGFPLDPDKWSIVQRRSANDQTSSFSGSSGVVRQIDNLNSINIPVGSWKAQFSGAIVAEHSSIANFYLLTFLSESSTAETNIILNSGIAIESSPANHIRIFPFSVIDDILVTSAKTYYPVMQKGTSSPINLAGLRGDYQETVIKFTIAYL